MSLVNGPTLHRGDNTLTPLFSANHEQALNNSPEISVLFWQSDCKFECCDRCDGNGGSLLRNNPIRRFEIE
jgi:hypothetical protein